MQQQTSFRDTRFGQEHGQAQYLNGDPYAFGRLDQMSGWERVLNLAGRLFGRSLTRVEGVANRLVILIEITHLRLRLRTLYKSLGRLMFYLTAAEDTPDPIADPRTQSYLDKLRETHRDLASERAKLAKMRRDRRRDEFAGA